MTMRKEFLRNLIEFSQLKGLEIGALDSPLVTATEPAGQGKIYYLDHLSTEDLRSKYQHDDSVNVDNIVPVDFLCRDGDIVEATGGNIFDYAAASHVIEHTPNLLQFLIDIHKILKPGGQLILIIPDKRFTFDVNRPVTTFGAALEKYCTNETKPSISAVYDHFALANATSGHNIWYGSVKPEDNRLLASEQFAWQAAQSVLKNEKYFDVHVNIFTPASFFEILRKATSHHLVAFEVEKFEDTQIGQIEFMVALRKPPSHTKISSCLASIPKLKLDSLLSPYMPQVKGLSTALEGISALANNLQQEGNELRANLDNVSLERNKLAEELASAQKTLGRRSVKTTLLLIDKLFSLARGKAT